MSQSVKAYLPKLREFLICAFAFLIILKVSIAVFVLILLLTVVIIEYNKKILLDLAKSPVLLLFIGFYVWHLAGMLWSSNLAYGFKDMETKLSYLVFPLLFSSYIITPSIRKNVFIAFVSGCILLCIYLLVKAFIDFQSNKVILSFFYSGLSRFVHPTYLAMYLNVAIILLLSFFQKSLPAKSRYAILTGILFLITSIMMLSSRMAIFTTVFTCTIYLFLTGVADPLKKRILYPLLFIATCSAALYITNGFYNRIEQVEIAVTHFEEIKPETNKEYNSATSRPELWKEALEVILKNPIVGTGTGDIKDELYSQYVKHDFQYAIERRLNPHNQFLHTSVALGAVGLILLLLCIGMQLYVSFRNMEWMYMCFLIVILFNCLTESILEVQSGILLFNFFSLLFYTSLKRNIQDPWKSNTKTILQP